MLPRGTGRERARGRVCSGRQRRAAKAAGAEIVGFEDLADQIKGGMMDFDVVIATPDAMRIVGQLGQILGRAADAEPEGWHRDPERHRSRENAKAGQCNTVPTSPVSSTPPSAAASFEVDACAPTWLRWWKHW